MALSREQIMAIDDGEREEVTIPAWGGSVWVRTLSADEKDYWERGLDAGSDASTEEKLSKRYDRLRARTAVLSCCDAQGAPLFVMQDMEWLGRKSAKALDKIWDVFVRLNAIGKEEVEALTKNSVPIEPALSGSISPSPSVDAL